MSVAFRIYQVIKLLFAHKTLLAQYAIVIKPKLSSRHKKIFTFVLIFFHSSKSDFSGMIKSGFLCCSLTLCIATLGDIY